MGANKRRILELISEGKLAVAEAAELLSALEKKKREPVLRLEISSSRQSAPLLSLGLSVRDLPGKVRSMEKLLKSEFSFIFESGHFYLDLQKLNWRQIFELAGRSDAGTIYYYETKSDENEILSLKIYVT